MEGQQEAFGETAPKEGNYEKQGKNQSSEGLEQQGLWYPGSPRGGGESVVLWDPRVTL